MDVVVSPALVGFNKQSGAPKLALQPGQIIDALVLQIVDGSTVRLAIGEAVVDLHTEVPLTPGATVRLAVKGTPPDLKLVIVSTSAGAIPDAARRAAPQAAATAAEPALAEIQAPQVQPGAVPTAVPAAAEQADPAMSLDLAVRAAAARQGGLAPLFADLAETLAVLPPPVRQAATVMLALRPSLATGVAANVIQSAVARSGLFMEQHLALAAQGTAPVPSATDDLKVALLNLRNALNGWLGGEPSTPASAVRAVATREAPPPPYRGAPPHAQPPVSPAISTDTPARAIGEALREETDAALARQTLLQAASLSEPAPRLPQADTHGPRWNVEIPFALPLGTTVAQFEVARDGTGAVEREPAPTWRANFSLDVEPLGPVHAQVAVSGSRATVRLWAERAGAAALLRHGVAELGEALRGASLEPGDILVRDGTPPRPAQPAPPGRFLDRAS